MLLEMLTFSLDARALSIRGISSSSSSSSFPCSVLFFLWCLMVMKPCVSIVVAFLSSATVLHATVMIKVSVVMMEMTIVAVVMMMAKLFFHVPLLCFKDRFPFLCPTVQKI